MSFSRMITGRICRADGWILRHIQVRIMNEIKFATLQVRIPLKNDHLWKRASFSAPASMSLEAALVLPLFLFAGVVLMMPFRILDVERQMQAIVNSVGEDISRTAYLLLGDAEEKDGAAGGIPGADNPLADAVRSGFAGTAAAYGYAEGMIRTKAGRLPVNDLSLADSTLLEDGETVELVVRYRMELPFAVFGLAAVERSNRCCLRAWIGQEGGAAGEDADEDDDPIVYVGKGSTRYHNSSSCHYLSNRLTTAALSEIENYRNTDGRRYTACTRCGGRAAGTVYIMPYGEHYHADRDCSAIRAYVRAVRRSSVEHLGPCSYCSGG